MKACVGCKALIARLQEIEGRLTNSTTVVCKYCNEDVHMITLHWWHLIVLFGGLWVAGAAFTLIVFATVKFHG